MGVDLRLIPATHGRFDGPTSPFVLGHAVLHLDRDYGLWDRLRAIPSEPIPQDSFSSWFARREDGENEYGYCNEDPYGNRLRWVRAGDLATVLTQYDRDEGETPPNTRAAAAYVAALHPDTPVVLYWH
jgi:hypothetical protein